MMKKLILTGFTTLAFTATAFASQCPMDMSKIDAALQTAQLSAADKTMVMEWRTKGEELHKAGNHPESVETLGKAKKMLGIE